MRVVVEENETPAELPVHGFVLAGGQSTRMGRDKALTLFRGRPMVEIAVGALRGCCAAVSIAGSREDLAGYAPVVPDLFEHRGPAGGMEAALLHLRQPWALFLPVDVPLLPGALLQRWCNEVLRKESTGVRLSYLRAGGIRQPAIALVHRELGVLFGRMVAGGILKLGRVYELLALELGEGAVWMAEAEAFCGSPGLKDTTVQSWFRNVNTPEELAAAEAWSGNESGAGTLLERRNNG